MGIVRGDRRAEATAGIQTVRQMLESSLVQAAGGLAALDMLEVRLGLASPEQIDARAQYAVLHVPPGSSEGHELAECATIGCEQEDAANATLGPLADLLDGSGEDPGEGDPPG